MYWTDPQYQVIIFVVLVVATIASFMWANVSQEGSNARMMWAFAGIAGAAGALYFGNEVRKNPPKYLR